MTFDAEVRASGRGSHAVVVPKTVATALPTRRVRAQIGTETFEATLGAYGGRTFLGLSKRLLTALGASAGDTVHVELEPLSDPALEPIEPDRTTCPELEARLATDESFAAPWHALPEAHRAEYARWISTADDPSTREARLTRLHHRLTSAGGGKTVD